MMNIQKKYENTHKKRPRSGLERIYSKNKELLG